jgi:Ser/Thr protein kinase RdoA (MazF antagonist)
VARELAARPVPLAIVHHANQYLVAEGYDNRQGLGAIAEGYGRVLRLHERFGIPAALHLSGTLVEAAAWGAPDFLEDVRRMTETGLVRLVGGTYGENVMPLFDRAFNREQLVEAFAVYQEHLGSAPEALRTAWVPERVWETGALAGVFADPTLPNGGFHAVLVDDRLLYPPGPERDAFDARGPYGRLGEPAAPDACRPVRIAAGAGLVAVPISAALRYWIPPADDGHEALLASQVDVLAGAEGVLLVYGDDMEKTAGVAGWQVAGERFERFLGWLDGRRDVVPVHLDEWLDANPAREERPVGPGAFHELAVGWGAGEDYRGWADAEDWRPYRDAWERSRAAVEAASEAGAEPGLLRLARRHLLAGAHETAWRDPAPGVEGRAPAPWARALASHSRHAAVVARAARLLAEPGPPAVEVSDVDGDGEEEVLLRAGDAVCVVAPRRGGRILFLFEHGRLNVGNPTDHWNFQEELNRFMDVPPNHPGALADAGYEHDDHWVVNARPRRSDAAVELVDSERGSPLRGARKALVLLGEEAALVARYEVPRGAGPFATTICLSPHYERLVRLGRRELARYDGDGWTGWRNGGTAVWVAIDGEEARFEEPEPNEVGHGLNVRVEGRAPVFHVTIGWGETDGRSWRAALAAGRRALEAFRRAEPVLSPDDADVLGSAYGLQGIRLLGYLQGSVAIVGSDQGELVLRRRERAPSPSRERFITWLAGRGFPAPRPLATRDGLTSVEVRGVPHDLAPRAQGERVSRLSPAQARSAGETLARLHALGSEYPGDLDSAPSIEAGLHAGLESLPVVDAGGNGARAELAGEIDALRLELTRILAAFDELGYATLPHAIVHWDFRRSNLLFAGDAVSAVLDLGSCRHDARVGDVGTALSSLARGEGDAFLDARLSRELLAGYRSVSPLEPRELEALPVFVEAAFARAALVRAREGDPADRAEKLRKHGGRLRSLAGNQAWKEALA